jgi:radical SAM superfamily enzyme YgiQ (UPF0313 family)
MRLCLVAPPTLEGFEEGPLSQSESSRAVAEHAPMGVLSLAAVLEKQAITPRIVDLNRLHFEYSWPDRHYHRKVDFCSLAAAELFSFQFDVVGFSTMCSTYPLSLRIARELKQVQPDTVIVFGGPQASVVDIATLDAFRFVDIVVRGEAEETLPRVLGALAGRDELKNIPGITFRDRGRVNRNPNAPVISDLDSLPLPAFHLYPGMEKCRYIPLELGRGCPFACVFCSTNDFFRRRFRLKSPAHLLNQMTLIEQSYGVTRFDLIHDMFTVDRHKVVDFCEALLSSGNKFTWSCSARTDFVDDDLLRLMFDAGCRGIFFGIESGSPRMQRIIDKRLDLPEAARTVESCGKYGIPITISMINGFPEEEPEDLRASVNFIMDCVRFDHVTSQLNILAPLAETPLYTRYRDQLVLDNIFSDMSHQGWYQDVADRKLIASYPEIFPNFYGLPCPLGRAYLDEFNRFFMNAVLRFRWLLLALHQESGDLLEVFDAWRAWGGSRPNPAKYYCTVEFTRDFKYFLGSVYLKQLRPDSVAVASLVHYYEALDTTPSESGNRPTRDVGLTFTEMSLDSIPQISDGVRVLQLDADVKEVIDCLRAKKPIDSAVHRPTVLATRHSPYNETEVLKIPSLSAQILALCDGKNTVHDILEKFSCGNIAIGKTAAGQICLYGLHLLNQSAVMEFMSSTCQQSESQHAILSASRS